MKKEINKVISSDGRSVGVLTGGSYKCQMEGCRSNRVGVRWADGKVTFPCMNGMNIEDGFYRIVD